MRKDDFDLHGHIEAAGHSPGACFHLAITDKTCRGFLVKMGGKIKTWKKRWFVFDHNRRTLTYYAGEAVGPATEACAFPSCRVRTCWPAENKRLCLRSLLQTNTRPRWKESFTSRPSRRSTMTTWRMHTRWVGLHVFIRTQTALSHKCSIKRLPLHVLSPHPPLPPFSNVPFKCTSTPKSPNPSLTFSVKTHNRVYYMVAPSAEAMRIWMDVIVTGAEGHMHFMV